MEQINSSNQPAGGNDSSFFSRIMRVITGIGAFMDVNGYKKEMDRSENELRQRNG